MEDHLPATEQPGTSGLSTLHSFEVSMHDTSSDFEEPVLPFTPSSQKAARRNKQKPATSPESSKASRNIVQLPEINSTDDAPDANHNSPSTSDQNQNILLQPSKLKVSDVGRKRLSQAAIAITPKLLQNKANKVRKSKIYPAKHQLSGFWPNKGFAGV